MPGVGYGNQGGYNDEGIQKWPENKLIQCLQVSQCKQSQYTRKMIYGLGNSIRMCSYSRMCSKICNGEHSRVNRTLSENKQRMHGSWPAGRVPWISPQNIFRGHNGLDGGEAHSSQMKYFNYSGKCMASWCFRVRLFSSWGRKAIDFQWRMA